MGPLKNNNLSDHYKKQIVMNPIPNQREQFDLNMNDLIANNTILSGSTGSKLQGQTRVKKKPPV